MWKEISTKLELPLCFFGVFLCRMLNLIATVYLNLWISTFYKRDAEGQIMAKQISASLSGSSMGLALLMSLYFGYLADKAKISTLLVCSYGASAFGLILFSQISSPTSPLLHVAVIGMNIGN